MSLKMKAQRMMFINFLLCSMFLQLGFEVAHCSSRLHLQQGPKKLFVFGDSYADTGNDRNPDGGSWKEPYGVTFPGKPAGRFCDGLIFTDFLATFLGLQTPIAYTLWRTLGGASHLKYGVNLAFGGTGVFDTVAPYPNMTTQIDIFQKLISEGLFTPLDLQHSVAHVSLVGNDYSNYLANGGSIEGLKTFMPQVISQLALNLQRIYKMGVTKISVTGLQTLGCLPRNTNSTQYQQCNTVFNKAAQFHNLLLDAVVSKLNNQTSGSTSPAFFILDLYKAFSSIIQPSGFSQRDSIFNNPLKPCCDGINSTYICGSVDVNGNKMYTICEEPESYFFWDFSHPTQAGWLAIVPSLIPSIQQLRH